MTELYFAERQFTMYGPSHWAAIAVFAIGSVLLGLDRRRQSHRKPGSWPYPRGPDGDDIGMVLVYSLIPPDIGRSVPLNLTDLATGAAAYALWSQRHWAFALTYYWGLVLSTQALIFPVRYRPGFPRLPVPRLLVDPSARRLGSHLPDLGPRSRPGWRGSGIAVTVTVIWAAAAFTFNRVAEVNYGFLNGKPRTPSLLLKCSVLGRHMCCSLGRWGTLFITVWALMTWPWGFFYRIPRVTNRITRATERCAERPLENNLQHRQARRWAQSPGIGF